MKLVSWKIKMENKNVGYLLLGISVLIIVIIYLFNSALNEIVTSSCGIHSDGTFCPLYGTIDTQTYMALAVAGILVAVSLFLIFSKQKEKVVIRKVETRVREKKIDTSELNTEEKKVLGIVQENKAVFQADLIEKTGFGKAKMTRIIDRLEGRGLVERKRRGLTNVVVLKN